MAECLIYADRHLQTPQPTFLEAFRSIKEPQALTDKEIEAIALSVREKLGLGTQPITNLVRTLEKAGIAILRYASLANVKMDGLSQHTELGRPLCAIIARDEPSRVREYFSLAHELGHIVLHSQVSTQRYDALADAKILEDQANRFASSFLLPAQAFLNDLMAPTLGYFEFLKRKWHVSIAAMIRRCYDLEQIDRAAYASLNVRLSQKRWRTKEPLDDVLEIEKPILLEQIFRTLSEREGISGARVAQELSLNPRDLASISGLPLTFFLEPEHDEKVLSFG